MRYLGIKCRISYLYYFGNNIIFVRSILSALIQTKNNQMNNQILISLALLFLSLFLLSSCNSEAVKGDGKIMVRELPISDYHKLDLKGKVDVVYEYKPSQPPYLRVEVDENIYPLLKIKSDGGKLSFDYEQDIDPTSFKIFTNSTGLKSIEDRGNSNITLKGTTSGVKLEMNIKGLGSVIAEDLRYDEVDIDVAGKAELNLRGLVNYIDYDIKGQANINASELVAQKVKCSIAGNGNIEVNTIQQLDVEIKGTGDVKYLGNPPIINQKILGNGSVSAK